MNKFYKIFAVLIGLPIALLLYASSSGSPGGHSGSPGDSNQTCTSCHTGAAINQSGWITSTIPSQGYTPGQTYQITVSGVHTGVVRFGFELTAENSSGQKVGTFAITESTRTKLVNQNKAVTHLFAGTTPSGNSNSWNVNWTAPATDIGQITFYAALNAANGDGGTSGDVVYRTTLGVNAMAPATLLSVLPSQADQGSSPTLTITGQNTNWAGTTPVVRLRKSGTTNIFIESGAVSVASNTQLQANFSISPTATPGAYDVLVNDLVLANAFTVNQLIPSLIAIVPNFAAKGETVEVTITAENTFWIGTTPSVSMAYSGSLPFQFFASSVTVLTNNSLTAVFTIPFNTAVGLHDLMVNDLNLPESFTVTVVDNVSDNSGTVIAVYPNPTSDFIHIEAVQGSIIRIYNMNGKLTNEFSSQEKKTTIYLSGYNSGTYILEVLHNNKRKTQKIIVR
ncbi:MAG: choice-of-anchor V domain-containing protein [Bacteroidales bacterium]|nr:choice-of-anchor V domain-containing protein [Bacteroidales bacterium]